MSSPTFWTQCVSLVRPWLVIALFTASIAAQQSITDNSQSKLPEASVITGRVVNESGQPLSGVRVYVSAIGSSNRQITATDTEGNFKVQGLDAGIYRISAGSPGYVTQNPQADANNPAAYYRPGDSANVTLVKGGVIAGTVTNDAGTPIVNVTVRAFRVRDSDGKQLQTGGASPPRLTDDRGYYRIYGLQPGSYVIAAGGQGQYFGSVNPFANDAPTYAPASTRDTAVEIVVRSDQEATADIRYRGEPGHAISGKVTGTSPPLSYPSGIRLSDVESHWVVANTGATGEDQTFQLSGISDGEYEIIALAGGGPSTELLASSARRITVRGSDVTGIELALAPLASIAGRVRIEPDSKLNCGRRRDTAMRETMIIARRERVADKSENKNSNKAAQTAESGSFLPTATETVPNDNGEINFRNLPSGPYRVEARLPGAGWYLKELVLGANLEKSPTNKAPGTNVARDGVTLKSGERVSGLTVTITEGAASLRGRLTIAEGQSLPSILQVYLVPAEKEGAENVLRFFEARAESDGSFVIRNIAPGRFWLIGRAADDRESAKARPIRQDSALRSQVLKEAEKTRNEIQLQPCQRIVDYEMRYPPAASETKPKP